MKGQVVVVAGYVRSCTSCVPAVSSLLSWPIIAHELPSGASSTASTWRVVVGEEAGLPKTCFAGADKIRAYIMFQGAFKDVGKASNGEFTMRVKR